MKKQHTLVTFLGRGRQNQKTGNWEYSRTKYRFRDQDPPTELTPLFGTALAAHIKPDRIVILGTRGSSWSVLLENLKSLNKTESSLIDELFDAEIDQRIDQEMLDNVTDLISRHLNNIPVIPYLIPFGENEDEQYDILKVIAKTVPEGNVSLDLTHGFRHLGMIGFLSAFMLESVRGLEVKDLWYGALDMTPRKGAKKGITPVLTLDGLDRVRRWMNALERFDVTGDYSVFVPLLEEDGVDSETAQHLEKTAFHERTSNLFSAADEIKKFQGKLGDKKLAGASGLFQDILRKSIAWVNQNSLAKQQGKLAEQYLARGDYVRAAIFHWEALITKQCEKSNLEAKKRTHREEADQDLKDFYYKYHGPNEEEYKTLNQIRNAVTHGTPPDKQKCKDMLRDEELMASELKTVFNCLKV